MIRIFAVDIDGCLTIPFKTPHWESFSALRARNMAAKTDPAIPKLAILTGRPQPYAEAMAQMLDIDQPVIFESGGGLFDPVTTQVHWSPEITPEVLVCIGRLRRWAAELIAREFPDAMLEFAKHTDVGFIHQDSAVIDRITRLCRERVACEDGLFSVHHTEISVNVILTRCDKGSGLRWISERTGVPLEQIAYIGDSSGDVPALKIAGRSFSPSNAAAVAKAVSTPLDVPTSQAVLKAYLML